ncbi:outer membrane protein assembly factor BamD [Saprospiraceae bacterium]|nr:outer membrane protein assembly factor BamD [Saprospiraceae bacterium]
MIKKLIIAFPLLFVILFTSCKTEYEKVRASGDPELMVKTADSYFKDEKFLQAQTLYEIVIPFYRGKEEAAEIFFKYAYTHYYLREYILASHYFKSFSTTYYSDENREEAMFMSAYSNYELSPNPKLDQSYSDVAIEAFQLFINTFPESERVTEANKLIDEMRDKMEVKSFSQGQLYLDIKQYEAAMVGFDNMLQEYPDSEMAEKARYLGIVASHELAKNSIYGKQVERYKDVLLRIDKYEKKHKKSSYRKELKTIKKDCNNKISQ